jgi:hypothetical protein
MEKDEDVFLGGRSLCSRREISMNRFATALLIVVGSVSIAVAQANNGSGNGNGNRGTGNGNGNGNGNANGNNNGNGNGNGNSSSATISNRYPQNAPSVFAPGLTAAGIESCMGSASMGGSVAGFGISLGSTTEDRGCQLRLYARTLHALGHRRAATQILCNDPEVMQALAYEGFSCQGDNSPMVEEPLQRRSEGRVPQRGVTSLA